MYYILGELEKQIDHRTRTNTIALYQDVQNDMNLRDEVLKLLSYCAEGKCGFERFDLRDFHHIDNMANCKVLMDNESTTDGEKEFWCRRAYRDRQKENAERYLQDEHDRRVAQSTFQNPNSTYHNTNWLRRTN